MRGPTKTLRLAALTLGAVAVLSACSGQLSSSAAPAQRVRIVFVPKVSGIPYFEAMNTGGLAAAKQLDVQWQSVGPTTVDPPAQAQIVRDQIKQHPDVIVIAPNDPASIAPVMRSSSSGTPILPISSPKKPRITRRRASSKGMPRACR